MKNTKWIALGIAVAGVTLSMAQDAGIVPEPLAPPPPPGSDSIERDVNAALAEQHVQLMAAADRLADAATVKAGAQKHMMLAQAGSGGGMGGGVYGHEFGFATGPRAPRALVIPKDATDAASLGEVEEDLGVMAHILDKAASGGDNTAHAMGIAVIGRIPGMAAAPRNLYIEGHGAIFLLNVNFPLMPPPAKAVETEAKEPVNSEWEEARREMTRPGQLHTGSDPMEIFEERFSSDVSWSGKVPPTEYDAGRVDELKKNLISALKNAANIRRLKSDETVAVVVTGADAGALAKTFRSAGSKPGGSRAERVVITKSTSGERAKPGEPAKLILRARKADAEAFQNGKLDYDAFQKSVTVMIF